MISIISKIIISLISLMTVNLAFAELIGLNGTKKNNVIIGLKSSNVETKDLQNFKIVHISSPPNDSRNINLIMNNGLLYYTVDTGVSWTKVELCYNQGNIYDYEPSIGYDSNGIMYIGLNCGFFKARLKTQQWAKSDYPYGENNEFDNFIITKAIVDPSQPKRIYLHDNYNNKILKSNDFGGSWMKLDTFSDYNQNLNLNNVMINNSGMVFGISDYQKLFRLYGSSWSESTNLIFSSWFGDYVQQLVSIKTSNNFALVSYENPYWDTGNIQPQMKIYLNEGGTNFKTLYPPKYTESVYNQPVFIHKTDAKIEKKNKTNGEIEHKSFKEEFLSMIIYKANQTIIPKLYINSDASKKWIEFKDSTDFVNYIYSSDSKLGTYYVSTDSGNLLVSYDSGKTWDLLFGNYY